MSKFYRLLFVGAPGVGKGTYSVRAAQSLQCAAISSGDLLRKEVAEKSEIGKKLQSMIEGGVLVPDDVITKLVSTHLKELKDSNKYPGGYILDGYPRNVSQAKTLWDSKAIEVDHVINLTQPRNVIVTKLSSRRCCNDCGFVYNCAKINEGGIVMDPLMPKVEGVCDKCGSTKPLIIRKDDQIEVVEKRQNEYEEISGPLIDFYKSKGILHNFEVLGGTKVYLPKLLDLIKTL